MSLRVLVALAAAFVPAAAAAAGGSAGFGAPPPGLPAGVPVDEVAALLKQIELKRDAAPLDVIDRLAALRTREAALALVEAYDLVASPWMRGEVLRALATFDAMAEARAPALERLANAATTTEEPELRDAALDLLAECPARGRFFLRMIVDSTAAPAVRERAMLRHVEAFAGDEEDLAWYGELFEAGGAPKKRARGGEEEPPRSLTRVRELAFGRLAPTLKESRLLEVAREKRRDRAAPKLAELRRLALAELFARGSKRARKLAEAVMKDVTEPAGNRVAAARQLYGELGDELAGEFIEEGQRDGSVVPRGLRLALADMLADMGPKATGRKLVSLLKKAEGETALFALRALGESDDPKLLADFERLAGEDPGPVRRAAIEAVARSASPDRDAALERLLEGFATDPDALEPLIAVLEVSTRLYGDEPAWGERLSGFARDERSELRNAALRFLGEGDRADARELLLEALEHEDWSTRTTALECLTERRTVEATGAIVARMQSERGFMLNRFAAALWSLTGKPFGRSAARWARWWGDEGAGFEPISLEELARLEEDRELRRAREATRAGDAGEGSVQGERAVFFGVRVESKRVLFVLDVSGSMDFPLESPSEGLAVRMDAARRELVEVLSNLDHDTLFNLITFSGGVHPWHSDGVVPATDEAKADVLESIERLGSYGGTNLYGALAVAFSDRDVDTIVLLSDGEPEGGAVDDPDVIREEVARWNEHRHVTIHTVALGGDLGILRWLAEDSGGRYRRYE